MDLIWLMYESLPAVPKNVFILASLAGPDPMQLELQVGKGRHLEDGALIVIVQEPFADGVLESVMLIVTVVDLLMGTRVLVPGVGVSGVPVITPVLLSKLRPSGSSKL